MINFFKNWKNKNTITLHCYTTDPLIFEHAKIQEGAQYFPEWWKDTPKEFEGRATIKSCLAIQEFYKQAVVIPSWFTAEITVHEKNHPKGYAYSYIQSYDEQQFDISHGGDQYPLVAEQGNANLKINSPWYFKCDEEVWFHWGYPYYNKFDNKCLHNMELLPAVVNYKYQCETNINYFVHNDDIEHTSRIDPWDPLVILHPMTNKKIRIENHLVAEQELRMLFPHDLFVLRQPDARIVRAVYKEKKKLYNKIEENNKSKCPFSKFW